MKVLVAQIDPILGDVKGNTQRVLRSLERAKQGGADIVLFPELILSGYPPEDLLLDNEMIEALSSAVHEIAPATKGMMAVVGVPRRNPAGVEKPLHNSAAIFIDGALVGFQDKRLLPTYDVFDERRYFEPGVTSHVWEYLGRRIGVTICEDVWQHGKQVGYTHYSSDPILDLKEAKLDLLLNISSSPYHYQKKSLRLNVFATAARTLGVPLIVCNQVGAHDQLIFDGRSFYLNEKGELLQMASGFQEEDLWCDLDVVACSLPVMPEEIGDLYRALVLGVRDYFHKQGFTRAILGLSGGIDSALVACIAVEALGADRVWALALPSRFNPESSTEDAAILAERLGIQFETLSIEPIFQGYLDLLGARFEGRPQDVTEENLQARVRGMILMAYSNKFGHLLLNTSNKSEFAMGYTTLYGDLCGALGVLSDVTKTRIYELSRYVNRKGEVIPETILQKVPSAELKPNQSDLDTLPPFEVLDPIIEEYIEERLSLEEIAKRHNQPLAMIQDLVHRIHLAEYKRRQAPIGLRVTPRAFSKGRYVPIVQKWR